LRVVIDARKIADTGIGVYTENLIKSLLLVRSAAELELILLGNADHLKAKSWSSRVTIFHDITRPYSYSEHFTLGKTVNSLKADLLHVPHYTLPRNVRVPTVVTVHDLIHLTHPEKFYYPTAANFLISHALKRASKIIAVSQATATSLQERAKNALGQKIKVVPNALNPSFLESPLVSSKDLLEMGIKGEYLFSLISMDKPHKNLSALIEAFKLLKGHSLTSVGNLELVLAGSGTSSLKNCKHLASYGIRVLGRVSFSRLKTLYAAARCVVIPSLAEGFCLPVLEARAMGRPLVVTPDSAIKELAGEEDIICEGFSAEHIAQGLLRFFDANLAFVAKGNNNKQLEWLGKFSRNEIGEQIFAIYKEALAGL